MLSGPPGFLGAEEADRLDIAARPAEGDPLSSALTDGRPVGSLLLEPRLRRRMRANGRFSVDDGRVAIRTTQVLSNCTRYIQKRSLDPAWVHGVPRLVSDEPTLSDRQRRWIDRADTAFIATTDIDGDADMSHRGGRPGWITVTDGRVAYDEQPGNAMYLTLGNLERTRSAGLLFVDFDTGGTLHVAGECQATYPPSGQPRLSVTPIRVVELAAAAPAPWSPPEFSPDL